MLFLGKTKLPSTIEVDGSFYTIHTDFRYWFLFYRQTCEESYYEDFDFIYLNEKPKDRKKGFEQLLKFFNPPKELPRNLYNDNSNTIVFDYVIDSDLIYSAFYEVYHIDLMDESFHLHWWKFLSLFDGLHGTKLNEIIEIRCYNPQNKIKYEEHQKRLKNMWELPQNRKASPELEKFSALLHPEKK